MRRHLDFYPTPEWATRTLLGHVTIRGLVFECCVGDAAISEVLQREIEQHGDSCVITGDIDAGRSPDILGNALDRQFWNDAEKLTDEPIDWVVTNPPFSEASQIVPIAFNRAQKGIAMLLRLSFLEPVEARGAWLNEHPPTTLIVLPRISFTNDGKTDSVTCAWMVWRKGVWEAQRIIIAENPRFQRTRETQQEAMFA